MAQIGADPDQLKALGDQFRRAHQQLSLSRGTIEAQIRRTRWSGVDAERFRTLWATRHRGSLESASESCRVAAKHLDRQIEDQIRASAVDPSWSPGVFPLPLAAALGSAGVSGRTAPSSIATRTASGGIRPPGPAFPERVLTLGLGAELTVTSLLAGSRHQIAVEEYGADVRRVTISDFDGAGVKGSLGASISLGGTKPVDMSGSAKGVIGVVTRRTFETDADGVWRTVTAAEAERSGHRIIQGLQATGVAPPLLERVVGFVTNTFRDRFDILPTPIRSEDLVELAVTGSIGASLPVGSAAQANANGVLRVGTSTGRDGESLVIEAEGSLSRSLNASLKAGPQSLRSPTPTVGDKARPSIDKVRIELFDSDDQPRLMVTSENVVGSTLHKSISEVDLSDHEGSRVVEGLRTAVEQVRRGQVDSGLGLLGSLKVSDQVSTSAASFDLDASERTVGAAAGEGLSFGGEGTFSVNKMTRR